MKNVLVDKHNDFSRVASVKSPYGFDGGTLVGKWGGEWRGCLLC